MRSTARPGCRSARTATCCGRRAEEVDAERFEALVATGLAAADKPQRAIEALRAALALWRGGPFGDTDLPELAAAQSLGDARAEADARRMLGSTLVRLGLVEKSVEHLERARDRYRAPGSR